MKDPHIGRSVARRKKKEEVPDWTPPEFDETDFMRKEVSGARAAAFVVGWALLGALISFGLYYVNWVLAFFVGLLAVIGLYYVFPLVGVRREALKRRDWIGHGAIYFFSWLAIWVLLLNPPFSDNANPVIHGFQVGSWNEVANPGPAPATIACITPSSDSVNVPLGANGSVFVVFRATDNVAVTNVQVTVNGAPATFQAVGGLPSACRPAGSSYAQGTYTLGIPGPGPILVRITASDAVGHTVSSQLSISTS